MQAAPLFDVPVTSPAIPVPYPAFESAMGDTHVWETDDLADSDELWRRAVALQLLLDRIGGLS